jgi:ribose transport system substrate-binding protein
MIMNGTSTPGVRAACGMMRGMSSRPACAARLALAVAASLAGFAAGCGQKTPAPGASGGATTGAAPRTITIGLVAKSQGNAVFQAAHAGALAAARELGAARGLRIEIDWQTPPEEDPQKQAQAIEQLARAGVAGIAVSCSDANTLTSAIDKAVELGSQVMCFDSDAPQSRRFCFFGTDDGTCGEAVMRELAAALGETGTIAILAGNASAPNLQARVEGVKRELARHPNIHLLDDGVYYHPETPEQAAETMRRAQSTHPEIDGWALVGGWPLYTRVDLGWEPGHPRIVSVDALPAQLPYLTSGHVEVLLAQDCFGWGHKAVEVLLDKIVDGEDPAGAPRLIDPLTRVTAADVPAWTAKWEGWLAR